MHRPYLVFSQAHVLDLPQLASLARVHFDARLDFPRDNELATVTILDQSATFSLNMRESTAADWGRALGAELRGRAAGMAALAARCPRVVEVAPEPSNDPDSMGPSTASSRLLFALLGGLASLLLGPVLPPDDSTLYGTRGARERMLSAQNSEQK